MKVYIIGKKTVKFSFIALSIMLLGLLIMPWSKNRIIETAKADKERPIYCVETEQPQISISFDAAWGAEDTDDILAVLDQNDVKATFFLVSNWIQRYPDEVRKIYEAGHDIGNHSDTHPKMDRLNKEQIKNEVMGPHELIKDLLNIDMELFRAPYGAYNDTIVNVARECGYYTIQWNVDSLDWKAYGKQDMYNRVVNSKRLDNGSIILFHNNAKYTAEALDDIIKGLSEKGYELVPISELIMREDYYIDHTGRQCRTEEAKKRDSEFFNPPERNDDEEEAIN